MLDVDALHMDNRTKQHVNEIIISNKIASFQLHRAEPILLYMPYRSQSRRLGRQGSLCASFEDVRLRHKVHQHMVQGRRHFYFQLHYKRNAIQEWPGITTMFFFCSTDRHMCEARNVGRLPALTVSESQGDCKATSRTSLSIPAASCSVPACYIDGS